MKSKNKKGYLTMIKSYNGFKSERTTPRETLPVGGYVAKIMDATVISYDWGDVLKVDFDIAEGEYKGFFATDYRNNPNDDKKWRGTYRINIPDERNQYFDSQRKSFNNFIACLEETNSGFHFDWDESKLKGKGIGVLFRNKEWEYNGSTGWTTECCAVTTAKDVREGNFKMPKDKPLKAKAASAGTYSASAFAPVEDDSDLPF